MKSINIQRAGRSGQSGFTIIELVVVILLLGILAATALPRFISVTNEAHAAAVDAVLGGISTASALYRAEYVGRGGVGTTVASYSAITASATTGYPNITSVANCVNAFDNLLQGGHPTIAANAGAAVDSAAAIALTGLATVDFEAVYTTTEQDCVYLYRGDVASGAAASRRIYWNPKNGDTSLI